MNIGLPGTGIGGIFYLFSILIMFFVECVRGLKRRTWSPSLSLAVREMMLLLGVVACMVGLSWFLSRSLAIIQSKVAIGGIFEHAPVPAHFLAFAPFIMTACTFVVLVVGVQVAGFFFRAETQEA